MIEKCSIGNMTNNIQNITLILLILILIIVIIYYLKNSNAKHNELIEKYTNTPIESSDASYITHYSANSQRNSNFPSTGTTVTLRDCQVQFNNTFTKDDNVTVDDNATVKYTYGDEWKEIDTLTEPGSSPIRIPEKIISRSNETNAADITNYSERTKCFRRMTASDNKYRYAGNNLIQYREGSASEQGFHSELKVGANGTPENYMEMKFNLAPSNSTNYYNNLTSSICSLQYTNNLGSDTGSGLGGLSLYRLTLDTNNKITAINQITINSTNNHIFTVSQTTSFADLLTSTSTISYVYSDGNFIFKNNSSLSSETNLIGVKIYKFNRELLCSNVQKNIKSYQIFDNKEIDANKIVNVSKASFSGVINSTNFPDAAISYASKNAVKTAIERRIETDIATANADAIKEETIANNDITTRTAERDVFLTDINTKEKYLDKIFDTTLDASKKDFLIKMGSLELDKLGYQTEDVSSSETILTSRQEPLFSNSQGGDIYTIETYTDTSKTDSITFDTKTVCNILIVAGGGAGGASAGGGGGAGGLIYLTDKEILPGKYNITVGKGGSASSGNGFNSKFGTFEAIGGGGGASMDGTPSNGGSGGGGCRLIGASGSTSVAGQTGGTGTDNQGNNGGTGKNQHGQNSAGGGGGGAGAAGDSAFDVGRGANGGIGRPIDITGTSVFYAGGGGGGSGSDFSVAGTGGTGGGGNGGTWANSGTNGINGLGGGGGGGSAYPGTGRTGGAGGSGIVIIKYRNVPEQNENEKQMTLKYNDDNLVAWYKFDGNFNDSSGNGNNLTNVGSVIQSTHVIEGQAAEFDSTDYLEFPSTINPYTIWNGNGITFSFWVRFTTHENWARLIDFQDKTYSTNGIFISVKSGSGPAIWINVAGTILQYSDWNNSIISNLKVWNHVVFSIDRFGQWNVYLNKVRINNKEISSVPNITYNLRYINKSVYDWDGQWKGQMDDFRIYNRALSTTDVEKLYNKTYTLPSNTYKATFPISTDVTINGNKAKFDAGTYDIIMGPSGSEIRNRTSKILFGNYAYKDGNKLEFKYAITKTLQQLHDDSTSFSGTIYTIGMSEQKYSLGNKASGTIKKYRVYIYKRLLNHTIELYANNTLLNKGTDYITDNDEDAVPKTINLRNLYITINKNIAGIIYLKSDKPIFFISETNRTSFNNTTDAIFGTNVNNLKASGTATLSSLNNIFRVSEANTALTTAQNKKITYNINTILESPLTISYNSSTINTTNPAGKNSLDNLKTTYNNIHRYKESSSGALKEKINEFTFGNILNPTETDIEKYISYEYPTAPTDDKLTPSSRNTPFNIRSNATKYVYFRKSS